MLSYGLGFVRVSGFKSFCIIFVVVMSAKIYVGSVYVSVCLSHKGASPVLKGGAKLMVVFALVNSCSNLSWNTTDETLRHVSIIYQMIVAM